MDIFNNDDYKYVSNYVEEKSSVLRNNNDFNEKYLELSSLIDKLDLTLSGSEKNEFNRTIKLFYELEDYYFAFSYLLGFKNGNDLRKFPF